MPDYDFHFAYCSACDRDVEVGVRKGYVIRPDEPIDPQAIVCLEHGVSCTGELCPLFGVDPEILRRNLEGTEP